MSTDKTEKKPRKRRSIVPEADPVALAAAKAGADPVEAALADAPAAIPTPPGPGRELPLPARVALKRTLRMYYDIQRLRMASAGRTHHPTRGTDGPDARPPIDLDPSDKARLLGYADNFSAFEAAIAKDLATKLLTIPFYRDIVIPRREQWRGIGPLVYAVLLAEVDVGRAPNPSKLWRYAGMSVVDCRRCPECHAVLARRGEGYAHPKPKDSKSDDNTAEHVENPATRERAGSSENPEAAQRAVEPKKPAVAKRCPKASVILAEKDTDASGCTEHPEKGEVRPYNLFLKTKLLGVGADNILKARRWTCLTCKGAVSRVKAAEDEPEDAPSRWRHRSEDADCPRAAKILSAEEVTFTDSPLRKLYDQRRKITNGQDRWRSDAHRHRDAIRWMIKAFLLDWWKLQREYLGLPLSQTYQDAKLGTHARKFG